MLLFSQISNPASVLLSVKCAKQVPTSRFSSWLFPLPAVFFFRFLPDLVPHSFRCLLKYCPWRYCPSPLLVTLNPDSASFSSQHLLLQEITYVYVFSLSPTQMQAWWGQGLCFTCYVYWISFLAPSGLFVYCSSCQSGNQMYVHSTGYQRLDLPELRLTPASGLTPQGFTTDAAAKPH